MTIPEFSHLLGMIMDYHGLSWIYWESLSKPPILLESGWRVVENGGPVFTCFTCFIKTKLKTSKHTQKKGPPFISNHSLGDFPMVFRWFSFLRHCKELACRHGPRQDGRGILRSGTTRDAGNINEDGPEAYPHREYI